MQTQVTSPSGHIVFVPKSSKIPAKKQLVALISKGDYKGATLVVTIEWTSYLSITGSITKGKRDLAGGCLHQEIKDAFPSLASIIPFHLCEEKGPMHYFENVLFMAGDSDCWGTSKGEQRKSRTTGLPLWQRATVPSALVACDQAPAPIVVEFLPVLGEGKERDFNGARACAIWPDACDEELSLPKAELELLLVQRLPALLKDFKEKIESLGFEY